MLIVKILKIMSELSEHSEKWLNWWTKQRNWEKMKIENLACNETFSMLGKCKPTCRKCHAMWMLLWRKWKMRRPELPPAGNINCDVRKRWINGTESINSPLVKQTLLLVEMVRVIRGPSDFGRPYTSLSARRSVLHISNFSKAFRTYCTTHCQSDLWCANAYVEYSYFAEFSMCPSIKTCSGRIDSERTETAKGVEVHPNPTDPEIDDGLCITDHCTWISIRTNDNFQASNDPR